MKEIILNSGLNLIVRAQAKGKKMHFSGYSIGEQAAVDLDLDATTPVPVSVYKGTQDHIKTSVIDNNTLRVSIRIPETVGGFEVGNILLYANDEMGVEVPFATATADVSAPKYASSETSVGVSLELSMIFKYVNILDAIDITVTSPEYSSLQSYADESEIPAPEDFTYQQIFLQNYTGLGRPITVARRAVDNKLFGFPFLQRIDNPRFGWIDGGQSGDGYRPDNGEVIWGYYYVTPEAAFNQAPVTGGNYAFTDDNFDDEPYIADPY